MSDTDNFTPLRNPLAQPFVNIIRQVRSSKDELQSYREMLFCAIEMLAESERRDRYRDCRIDALVDENRRLRERQVTTSCQPIDRVTDKDGKRVAA